MNLPRKFKISAGIDPIPFLNVFFLVFMFYILNPHSLNIRVFNVNPYDQPIQAGIFKGSEAYITLKKNGSVLINNIPVGWDSLGVRIKEIYNTDSNTTVVIQGGKEISFGKIIDVMNVLRLAGIKKLRLAENDKNE